MIKHNISIKIFLITLLTLIILNSFVLTISGQSDGEELKPSVTVIDQPVIENTVTISRVVSAVVGWIVIHSDDGGSPGPVLGQTLVRAGINSGVVVNISSIGQTPVLYAMLHEDRVNLGVYDGLPAEPAVKDDEGNVITPSFNVLSSNAPVIIIDNQPVVLDKIVVSLTNFNKSGWITIHNQVSDYYGSSIGVDIGHKFLEAGTNRDFTVTIDVSKKTTTLYAKLYEDSGISDLYEGPSIEQEVIFNSVAVQVAFDTTGSNIVVTPSGSLGGISSSELHIILSIVSGVLLIGVGVLNISRNRKIRLNQIFFGFFVFIALYQIFDALMVYLGTYSDNFIVNLVRDLSISSLILGLSAGALSGLMIHYGEDIFFERRNLAIGVTTVAILWFLGVIGDSSVISEGGGLYGGSGSHAMIGRDPLGWIGITGSFLLFSGILIYTLITLFLNVDSDLRSRILRLLIGFVLVISLLFMFDVAFSFTIVSQGFMGDSILHFLMHEIIVIGVLFVLSAFWTPLKKVKE